MLRRALVPCLVAGCSGPAPPSQVVLNEDLAAPTLVPPPFDVDCARGPNALRGVCTIDLPEPGTVEVRLQAPDGRVFPFRSDVAATHHEIDLYLLPEDTVFVTEVVASPSGDRVMGRFETLSPPLGADVSFVVSEGTPGVAQIGFVSPCTGAYAVIVDPRTNEVLWYEDLALSSYGSIDALSFTETGTILALVEGSIVEVDRTGRRLLQVSGGGFTVDFHHDLFRRDGLTYVLFKEDLIIDAATFLLDGFLVFDEEGNQTNEWHLIDHFRPKLSGSWLPTDYSHANSIWVDDAQQVMISFRHLSAIAMIDGDPTSPASGEISWRLSKPGSDFGSDFALSSRVGEPADFERQHAAHFTEDGTLMMFDNRIGFGALSRGLVLSLDPESKKAQIEQQFVVPHYCDYQGSALYTSADSVLATCAPQREAWEFDTATGLVQWYGFASCDEGFGSFVPRFVPLNW